MTPLLVALLLMDAPPPPATHARYGPLTQCLSGYALTATATEGILATDGAIALNNETDGLAISIDQGDPYRSPKQATELEVPNLGHLLRFQRDEGDRPHLTTTYLIPSADGRPALLVRSRHFDGTEHDLNILARISRIEDEHDCGSFRAPAYPGDTPEALLWHPSSTPGPLFLCRNGVGFPILAGEAVQSPWWDDDRPSIRISSPNPNMRGLEPIHLVFHGPMDSVSGAGAVAVTYRSRLEPWFDGPSLLLMPPRTDSDRHGRDESYRRLIVITYPPGQEAAARAFVARILFVPATDPRCSVPRTQ